MGYESLLILKNDLPKRHGAFLLGEQYPLWSFGICVVQHSWPRWLQMLLFVLSQDLGKSTSFPSTLRKRQSLQLPSQCSGQQTAGLTYLLNMSK